MKIKIECENDKITVSEMDKVNELMTIPVQGFYLPADDFESSRVWLVGEPAKAIGEDARGKTINLSAPPTCGKDILKVGLLLEVFTRLSEREGFQRAELKNEIQLTFHFSSEWGGTDNKNVPFWLPYTLARVGWQGKVSYLFKKKEDKKTKAKPEAKELEEVELHLQRKSARAITIQMEDCHEDTIIEKDSLLPLQGKYILLDEKKGETLYCFGKFGDQDLALRFTYNNANRNNYLYSLSKRVEIGSAGSGPIEVKIDIDEWGCEFISMRDSLGEILPLTYNGNPYKRRPLNQNQGPDTRTARQCFDAISFNGHAPLGNIIEIDDGYHFGNWKVIQREVRIFLRDARDGQTALLAQDALTPLVASCELTGIYMIDEIDENNEKDGTFTADWKKNLSGLCPSELPELKNLIDALTLDDANNNDGN